MRILVLDDEQQRHDTFAAEYDKRGHEVVHVKNFAGAVAAMRDGQKFDFITLDHDLADFQEPTTTFGAALQPAELTGADVAEWMVACLPREKYPDAVRIHSWNTVGAKRMYDKLAPGGFHVFVAPFSPGKIL